MNTMKISVLYLITMLLMSILSINTISAQSLYTEYNDNDVYIYINNYQRQYWTPGPKLPHHELVITNIGSQIVNVRVLIRVVLRYENGNYLNETTKEKTVTVSPGGSAKETIWMSTKDKRNAYYCVEGFRVLSVTTQSATSMADKYALSEYGAGYYIVVPDFAYEYNMNVYGNWLPPKKGYSRGTRIYVYGTLASNPQLAVIKRSEWVGGDTYMRMCDLVKE